MRTRNDTLVALQLVMGELPGPGKRVPLDLRVEEEVREAGYTRRLVNFATEPGDRCWAWLLLPHATGTPHPTPGPAMLCLHQTTRLGKDEPAGLGGSPNLHYAQELARRGYIALAPDYPGYGQYHTDSYALGYASATMKGVWNHRRAVDLLASLPEVDAARIGCIGHSLGGHNTLFAAAFDTRLQVAVSSCGFTRFTWNDAEGRGTRGDLSDWSHAGYMPRIRTQYRCRVENLPWDFPDVLGAILPRAVFINAPRRDSMRVQGVRECVALMQAESARLGLPGSLGVAHPDCEHDFPPAVREEAYAFIDRHLRPS